MRTKLILAGIVVSIIIGGAAIYAISNGDDNNSDLASDVEVAGHSESEALGSLETSSINKLLERDEARSCSFNYFDETTQSKTSGEVYLDNGKMSGQFIYETNDGEQQISNIIQDSEYQYVWLDDESNGFKTSLETIKKLSEGNESSNGEQGSSQEAIDRDAEYDFECYNWTADSEKFIPPVDVSFTDYSAELEEVNQSAEELKKLQLEACATLTDESARIACETNATGNSDN